MGLELAASIIGLTLAGVWADHHFRSGPVGVLVGAGLGVVGGMYNFIREALQLSASRSAPQPPDERDAGDDHDERR